MIEIVVVVLCIACTVNSVLLTLMRVDMACIDARLEIFREQFFTFAQKTQEKG